MKQMFDMFYIYNYVIFEKKLLLFRQDFGSFMWDSHYL